MEDAMGTETRIGIVTGLLIVVVASVYFFYGSNSEKDDFLIATGSKVADPAKNGQPLKIPVGNDKDKTGTPPGAAKVPGQAPAVAKKPVGPLDKGPAIASKPPTPGPGQPPVPVAVRPTAPPSGPRPTPPPTATPAAGSAVAANQPPKAPVVGPPAIGVEPRRSVADATPAARVEPPTLGSGSTASGADKPAPGSEKPGEAVAAVPPRTTVLRTSAAKELLDATRENIEKVVNRSTTSAPENRGNPHPAGAAASESRQSRSESQTPQAEHKELKEPKELKESRDTKTASPATGAPATAAPAANIPSGWPKQHKIASGETIAILAQHYYGDSSRTAEILEANPQKDPRRLKIGDAIVIPAPKETAQAAAKPESKSPTEAAEKTQTAKPAEVAKASGAEKPAQASASKTYQVREGDTFYSIAKAVYGNGGRWTEIYQLNKATLKNDPKHLKPGMVLKLPE
jgi:nucleoid-associated protein YgaU